MPEIRIDRPLRLFAPAKVNLGLEILGRREDGYHDIVTVMQTISRFDEIVLTPSDEFEYCGDPRFPQEDDLAYRAIQLFEDRTGNTLLAKVRLIKRIPASGGLGGGSSDAGTILAALCTLAGAPREDGMEIASSLGSDVPFFLHGGTALASGTGTTIDQLPNLRRTWFVITTPAVLIQEKTASRYRSLQCDDFSYGQLTRAVADRLRNRSHVRWEDLVNGFSRVVYSERAVEKTRQTMLRAGAKFVLPSGAGPSLFTIVNDWEEVALISSRLSDEGLANFVCTNVAPGLNDARISRSRPSQPK